MVETVTQMRSLGIAQDEIHLADGVAVDCVGQDSRIAVAGHHFQAVGAEIGDQEIAVRGEGEAVGQRALQIAGGLAAAS